MPGPRMRDDHQVDFRPGQARPAALRSFHHGDFEVTALVAARAERRVAVCLPARNEARTLGPIVASVRERLTTVGGAHLVDDIVVVDDGSDDDTAAVARRAGARVVAASTVGGGKGQAMALALEETDAELLVFLDADVENFAPHYVTGLLGPLLVEPGPGQPDVALVKGFYERPLHGEKGAGGRVTELVARPVIDLLFPALSAVCQPLAGETAAPRTVLEKTGLAPGYGVELALLIDVAEQFGVEQVAQVDLGVRIHRNRPLTELRPQALDVLGAALRRAGVIPPGPIAP